MTHPLSSEEQREPEMFGGHTESELRELVEKASAGPWRGCKDGECSCGMVWSIPGDFPVFTVRSSEDAQQYVGEAHTHMADQRADMVCASISEDTARANAKLIAAAVSSLPSLLDAAASLPAARERIWELEDLAAIIIANACLIPDPAMAGATDTYSVPLDDIEALRTLLQIQQEPRR